MLIIPGGFGIAKNFSNWATAKPEDFKVEEDIAKVIQSFYDAKKLIAASCIAPLIISKVLPNVTITLG